MGSRRTVIGLGGVGKALGIVVIFLVLSSTLLQRRRATLLPSGVPERTTVVLFAGAADAERRLEALDALCKRRRDPLTVLVGDDDEVEDESGRAWGPLLVDRVSRRGGCLHAVLVAGRVRSTTEELDALDRFLSVNPHLATSPMVFVTSPYHRARVDFAASRLPILGPLDRRFLEVNARPMDYAPTTTAAELLRILRDALGLSSLFGRRTLDNLREESPWPRPHGSR